MFSPIFNSQLETLSAEITTREIRQQPGIVERSFWCYKAILERVRLS